MNNYAVIDIGSNSVRMTVYDFSKDAASEIKNVRQYVRLSEGMQEDNLLKKHAVERTVNALAKMRALAEEMGECKILCVATEAVRRADNAGEFLCLVKEKTGIDIKILSGDEEARVGLIAVTKEIDYSDTVIIDVGGGSAEITLAKNKKLVNSVSLRLGAVVLTEQFKNMPQESMYEYVYSQIVSAAFLKEAKGLPVTALGGTASTITKVFGGRKVEREKIDFLYQRLKYLPCERRGEVGGIEPERADIILAGVTVYKALFDILGSDTLYYSFSNIRDGIAYELYNGRNIK